MNMRGGRLKRLFTVAFTLLLARVPASSQDAVPVAVSRAVSGNIFEVVVRKPTVDPALYESDLPTDLLPFVERNDLFYSVGTAFALPGGRFVTAAHVLSLDGRTLRAEAELRDTQGNAHPIEAILAYSNRRDYAVFTAPSLRAPGLPAADLPAVNSRVFSAGNALGAGIVIREGLLTSLTPERESGEWKWLRFSAAASPGNSGGPLLDSEGRAVGLVSMKSENENLNYALPMDELSADPIARYSIRAAYRFPHMTPEARGADSAELALPLPPDRLRALLAQKNEEWALKLADDILIRQSAECFPDAPGAEELLGDTSFTLVPMTAERSPDKTWSFKKPENINNAKAGADGYVETGDRYGGTFFELQKPSGATVSGLFDRPRALLDLLFQGWPVFRNYAGKRVRILSLGDPESVERFEDRWGRPWYFAVWPIPWAGQAQILVAAPTPRGATGMLVRCGYDQVYAARKDYGRLVQDSTFSYMGSFAEWKAWLASPELVPSAWRSLEFGYAPGGEFAFSGAGLSLRFDQTFSRAADDSLLAAVPSFYRENGSAIWNLGRLYYQDGPGNERYVNLAKILRPADGTPERAKRNWEAAASGTAPYDGSSSFSDGRTSILAARVPRSSRDEPKASPFVFSVFLSEKGSPENAAFKQRFNQLKNALVIRDGTRGLELIDGKDIFQTLSTRDAAVLGRFIERKLDLDAANDDGRTPFMLALRLQWAEGVAALLAAGPDAAKRDDFGQSALNLALRYADNATARKLVELGSDLAAVDDEGYTLLMLAMPAKFGDLPDLLMARGADVLHVNSYKKQALFYALENGAARAGLAVRLLESGSDPGLVAYNGWTPLMAALRYSTPEVVKLIMDRGVDLTGKDKDDWTTLHLALRNGKDEAAERILEAYPDVNGQTSGGLSSLLLAARYSTPAFVKKLASKGADPTLADEDGKTPLMAALARKDAGVVAEVIGLPRAAAGIDKSGWTALHYAAAFGTADQVGHLLAEGLDVSKQIVDGVTPLMFALNAKRSDSARLLLERDGSWKGTDAKQYTALHYACINAPDDIVLDLLNKMPRRDIDAVTEKGVTALHFAARYQSVAILKELLSRGASVSLASRDGWTPLMTALRHDRPDNARVFAAIPAAVAGTNENGWTALHFAARYQPELIEAVAPLFPDLNLRTNDGWTALHLAAKYGSGATAAIRWLVSRGADKNAKLPDGRSIADVAPSSAKKAVAKELR